MAQTHSPKTFLRTVRRPMLRRYFAFRNLAIDVPDDIGKRADIERMFAEILSLPADQQRQIERDLSEMSRLATPTAIQTLLREAANDGITDLPDIFHRARNHHERSLWVWLKYPELFQRTLLYEHMDRVAATRWQRRLVCRNLPVNSTDAALAFLTGEIQKLYQREGRGRYCKMDYFQRQEPLRHCFFAYPEDHAHCELAYGEDGELCRRTRRPTMEVVCVYRPLDGTIEILAPGGKEHVDEVANLFAGTILGMETPIYHFRDRAFDLNVLKDRSFDFPTNPEDGIDGVFINELRCQLDGPEKGHVVFRAKASRWGPQATHDLLETVAKEEVQTRFAVVGASMQLVFAPREDGEKPRKLRFTVAAPDSCSLKDDPHDQVAKKYLQRWGIAKAGPAPQYPEARRYS